MAEANREAEPNERAASSPRRPRRNHVISLCCAQSVHRVVEEVARNLEGLGFRTTVVTGAEARAALLGSRTDAAQPTIHVVCVQGSMQERVLKPLRQALATHGGPNHHLFVAVLDLAVPLAMVGQIRRFAEALERPPLPSAMIGTAAGGRETAAHRDLEQSPTRSYPSVTQVVERGGTKPPIAPEGDESGRPVRRTRAPSTRPRMAQIGPTSKYQAVTASNADTPAEPGVRKRRRARSRMSPAATRKPSDERVLGLPEPQERIHTEPTPPPPLQPPPLQPAAPPQQPPPPPAPGELRRRTTAPATPPPPPLTKTPSSTSLPAVGGGERQETTPYVRPAGGTPPEREAPARPRPPEPDRAMPRGDTGFRFTPPGVKGADVRRPQGIPVSGVPLSEVLRDPDKTMVEGVIAEVPRTASTLRLDEPPFPEGPRGKRAEAARTDEPVEPVEPVEPTMIIAAPRGVAVEEVEELEPDDDEPSTSAKVRDRRPVAPASIIGASPLPPATTGNTVVGPPPQPSPEALAELERVRREVGAAAQAAEARAAPQAAEAPAAGPRKTFGYLQREERAGDIGRSDPAFDRARAGSSSESSGTLVLRSRSAVTVDEEEILSDSASTLVQRPRAPEASAETSGTLVMRPRAGDGKPASESSGTVVVRPPMGADASGIVRARSNVESSGTVVLQPRTGPAMPGSESSGTFRPRLGDAGQSAEASGTLRARVAGARPGSESSGTLRPRLGNAGQTEGPSGTVVQPAPTGPTEVSESEKTLLREDGTFESSRELMQKIEASRRAQAPAPGEAASSEAQQSAFKAGKTVLYADSAAVPLPRPSDEPQGGTVVGPAPTTGAAKLAASSERSGTAVPPKLAAAASSERSGTAVPPKLDAAAAKLSSGTPEPDRGGTVVTSRPAAATPASSATPAVADALRIKEPDAPLPTGTRSPSGRKLPQSAVPTERHPLAVAEAEAKNEGKASRGGPARKRSMPEPSERAPRVRAGEIASEPSSSTQARPHVAAPRPRPRRASSRYGWLWILLALLTAGGGWGAYQAGLFSGRPSGTTVADAGTPRQPDPTPSDTAPRTSAGEAGAGEAGAAEAGAGAEAGAAEAGAAEAGAAEAGAAEAGAGAEAGAAEAGAAEAGAADAGAATSGPEPDPSTSGPPDAPGDPEPAASAGTPDSPSDTRGPDEPAADDGTPPTSGGEPVPPPGEGPQLSAEEQKLASAVEQRRVFMLKTLYTTRRQGEGTTFGGGWQRCAKLEVDGVKGWRLPHRREMKLVNAVLNLPGGTYWTRTVPPEDKSSAYVLDTNDGSLSLVQKSEPLGNVVCVRERDFPEK